MKITRKQSMGTNDVQVGDQIRVGKYTATCQKVTDGGFIFMLDQYLDKPYQMNSTWTNKGGYPACELRTELQKVIDDENFSEIRPLMIPFENEDLLRIATVGEFFGNDDFYEMDDAEQWELMKDAKNRIALRDGEYEWGWLQNKVKNSSDYFALVGIYGLADYGLANDSHGVRPVFLLVRE